MKFIVNSLEVDFVFEAPPKRIISLVPSQTELLYDLNLEENLVGITKFCIFPKHLIQTIKRVGGTKKVNLDKIKLLNPAIIICNKEENTLEMVNELSKICPVLVTNIITIEDNLNMILDFGKIFDKTNEAQKWIAKINLEFANFKVFIQSKPIQKVVYFIWKNPYMVAGSDTFIDELIKINHFDNIFNNQKRYPEIDLVTIINVDLILLSSEPYPFSQKDVSEFKKYNNTAKIILVDGAFFSWYGTRILLAFDYFKNLQSKI